jgi:hypothetical protein
MGKNNQAIWVGFAHVKRVGMGKRLGNAEGAQVYIAIRANNADEFKHKVIGVFRQNRMQMFSLEDIESEFDIPKDEENPHPATVEKIDLFIRLSKGNVFAWGAFYPYGEYERPEKTIEEPNEEEQPPAE